MGRTLLTRPRPAPFTFLGVGCQIKPRSVREKEHQQWTFLNELGLVFVSVYQRILHLLYVEDLLAMVKHEFLQVYDPKRTAYPDFDETFRQLKMEAVARAEDLKRLNLHTVVQMWFLVIQLVVCSDAVDQLSKFNQVGAALSMVYISGAPVMFVGCGQSYTDLKKLNVKSIVKTLLK
ncbi:hypothetical protein RJT34_25965 [Clitoria ternatea]|uniref:SRP54-type proteins GTP-binding domain-containing protein n=1 Tax=Clitoria ternatea TaxID=43366 RepID=A0AAN9IA89_CLITE